jgi:hypothetical protein
MSIRALSSRATILLVCGVFALSGSTGNSAQQKPVDPKTRFVRQITEAKDTIGKRKEELRWVLLDFERLGDWGKSDIRILTNDYARTVETWQKVKELYEAGKADEAASLKTSAKSMRDWRRRFEARLKQSEFWPAEHWAEEALKHWSGPEARAFAPKYIEAKQNASMAWGRFADSIAPDAKIDERIKLEDAAYAAESEAKIAQVVWTMREFEDGHRAKTASADLAERAKQMRRLESELTDIAGERLRVEQRQREWERHRKSEEEEFTRIYQKALEQPKSSK